MIFDDNLAALLWIRHPVKKVDTVLCPMHQYLKIHLFAQYHLQRCWRLKGYKSVGCKLAAGLNPLKEKKFCALSYSIRNPRI